MLFRSHAQRQPGSGKGFSLSNLSSARKEIPDSLLTPDSSTINNKRITAYRLSPLVTPYVAPMDTHQLNFANTTLVESKSLAVGYLGNVGSAAQSKIFSERKEARDFIFADPYDYYIIDPRNAEYFNTKIPYTLVSYTTEGGGDSRNERLKALLTMNFGKKWNAGGELDYIYSRGQYKNNGNKLLSYRLFASYNSDKLDTYFFLSNYNFINHENGGIANDSIITHPDEYLAEATDKIMTRKLMMSAIRQKPGTVSAVSNISLPSDIIWDFIAKLPERLIRWDRFRKYSFRFQVFHIPWNTLIIPENLLPKKVRI